MQVRFRNKKFTWSLFRTGLRLIQPLHDKCWCSKNEVTVFITESYSNMSHWGVYVAGTHTVVVYKVL